MNPTQARFLALWSRCGGIQAAAVYADLVRHYAEPTRHYHTLHHIRRCMRDLDAAHAEIPDPDAVELALWCHDVIYVPGAADNERRSAEWLQRWAGDRIVTAERVAGFILATTHDVAPADLGACFAVDIDLADLGNSHVRFRRNEACLRAERPDLDDVAYDACARAFLSALLMRPRIYHTDFFHARCEARARANLAQRLAQPALG
jgi:predicted metal-dependent HD superfamily phosphohydrolase